MFWEDLAWGEVCCANQHLSSLYLSPLFFPPRLHPSRLQFLNLLSFWCQGYWRDHSFCILLTAPCKNRSESLRRQGASWLLWICISSNAKRRCPSDDTQEGGERRGKDRRRRRRRRNVAWEWKWSLCIDCMTVGSWHCKDLAPSVWVALSPILTIKVF